MLEPSIATRTGRPYRRLTTAQLRLASVTVAALGVGLLYWSGREDLWLHERGLQALLRELGALLIVSVAVAMLWDLVGKRNFRQEILETTRFASDVDAAGLVRLGSRYLSDVEWSRMLLAASKLDIFVAYARTWRNAHLSQLQALLAKRDGRVRLFLPDPEDDSTMDVLARRFGCPADELRVAIRETREAFVAMTRPGAGLLQVYYRPGDRLFSCYRIDHRAVITLYSHSGERLSDVPTLLCEQPGSLYDFVRSELRAITKQSTLVHTSRPEEGSA